MCGIVGYVGQKTAKPYLLDGLKRLEYRGYDSAGLALFSEKDYVIKRNAGPVQGLADATLDSGQRETMGIAHTRWATHGAPNETNAHPHRAGDLVLVHNGIIENYSEIKDRLTKTGVRFSSQTDTEVFAQLIEFHRRKIQDQQPNLSAEDILISALETSMKEVDGHYAILLMARSVPGKIFGVQNGAPLVASPLKGGCLIASDIQAIIPYHNEVCFLPKGEILVAENGKFWTRAPGSSALHAPKLERMDWTADKVEKDGFDSFMLKEIFQQPLVVADTLSGRLPAKEHEPFIWDHQKAHEVLWKNVKKLYLIACGTSYHAALISKYFFEKWAKIDCEVDIASEFRYRSPVLAPGTVVGVISQSGETADTLAALRLANAAGASTFSICNVPSSTIARESGFQYPTKAGPEIGVASTKAFTAQLTVLCTLALDVGRLRGHLDLASFRALARLPHDLDRVLGQSETFIKIGEKLKDRRMVLFVGRGTMYPMALEGALKMKELTYLPSEGFAAGELKHGPIAYIDKDITVVTLAPKDDWYSKTLSNLEEIRARGGHIIAIGSETDEQIKRQCLSGGDEFIGLPESAWGTQPILSVVPLQLLAYGCAKALGRNIDKPRNLAKSVTVE
ncbi:MAG: glutamine--fructose-6-phosphate transaminase (isomerizing) [Bdellovibrionales bacterium]|nr:glutamine--fructose-6-phosphate transaminase (isomerizing) [Bdellovibrionales bacterium]